MTDYRYRSEMPEVEEFVDLMIDHPHTGQDGPPVRVMREALHRAYLKGKDAQPERPMISYEALQERCNELLDTLRAIKERSDSVETARHLAAVALDGDTIIWGETAHPEGDGGTS